MQGHKRTSYNGLTGERRKLLAEAERATSTAYAPYSKFRVGAAILTQSGKIITGSNVENAAYGSTICAERAAILRANAMGYRSFEAIAVIAKGDAPIKQPTAPCGACRQMLYELSSSAGKRLEIIFSNSDKSKIVITTIAALLPFGFGPSNLTE